MINKINPLLRLEDKKTLTIEERSEFTVGEANKLIENINTEISNNGGAAALTSHLNNTTDAHDASAISNVPSGNLLANNVQGALNELQTDINEVNQDVTDLNAVIGVTENSTVLGVLTPDDIYGISGTETVKSALNLVGNAINFLTGISFENVTQAGTITTSVTTAATRGTITTVSSTLAAGGEVTFIFNNPDILASSTVLISLEYQGGGIAIARQGVKNPGNVSIVINNLSTTTPFNAPLKINYVILN